MNPLALSAQAVADATGKVTVRLPAPSLGTWWQAAVVVPTAPTGATLALYLAGSKELSWIGPQPSATVVILPSQVIQVEGSGFTAGQIVSVNVRGGWSPGNAQGIAPAGPSSFAANTFTGPIKVTGPVTVEGNATLPAVTVKVTVAPPPVVATVGILSTKVKLLGPTTAVAIVPSTATQTYFKKCKIGFVIWGTPANKGAHIYLGDAAGGVSTAVASIPAGATKLVGSFSVAFRNAVTMRIAGTTGDYANVWAA